MFSLVFILFMSRSSLSSVMTLISVTGKCINLVHRMIISLLIYTPMHDSSKLFEASGLTPAFFVQRPVVLFFYLPLCICYGFFTTNHELQYPGGINIVTSLPPEHEMQSPEKHKFSIGNNK